MKLNEKNVASFATCSSPIDKEGYLGKKGEFNKGFQRRWCVLKGNLLFYFEKKQDKEPLGLVVLEACSVQASSQAKYAFEISFDGPATRLYLMVADNNEDMESWMKAISHASYEYMRSIVDELQRRVTVLTTTSKADQEAAASEMSLLHVGPAKPVSQRPKVPAAGAGEPEKVPGTGGGGRVENGILVGFSESQPSAPPIPKKKKGYTLANNPQQAQAVHTHVQSPPSEPRTNNVASTATDSLQKRLSLHQLASGIPYSSPYTLPSRLNPARPLSPPATIDRTAVLQPLQAGPAPFPSLPPPLSTVIPVTAIGEMVPMKPLKPAKWATRNDTSIQDNEAATPPLAVKSKRVAAPLEAGKTFYEMHDEFSRAVSAVRQERMTNSGEHEKSPSTSLLVRAKWTTSSARSVRQERNS